MSLINDRFSLKDLPTNTKLRLRSGEEVVFTSGSLKVEQPLLSNDLHYELNGVCSLDSPEKLNDRDVVGIVTNIDLNNVKEGDFVKLRNGKTVIVEKKDDEDNELSVYINDRWYRTNGLHNPRFISQLDIVEILKKESKAETYFKDLALSLLAEVSEDRLFTVPSNVVLDIVKEAHTDVTLNKVRTAFVALLEEFSRSYETVKLPAKELRDLINL